jgi:ParB family transcriptional regulator, chromosome partitioning protein
MGALMARKNLLAGLMGPTPTAGDAAPVPVAVAVAGPVLDPNRPRYAKGAVGAISRSVADLQARALMDIDPNLIDMGGLPDRLGSDPGDDAVLRESISEYGQQVPVLVRPHPTRDGRYQIVYGRRRMVILQELGRPVKALVRQLDDRDLVLAQGQENSARRDLSFIEKAHFARQMELAGYDRKIIGDTLSTDKTLISRFLSVAERIPLELMQAIGAAPSVGRERWLALADALEGRDVAELVGVIQGAEVKTSDERFEVALRHARGPRTPPDRADVRVIRGAGGVTLAEAERKGGRLTIRLDKKIDPAFDDWLLKQLPHLHQQWSAKK